MYGPIALKVRFHKTNPLYKADFVVIVSTCDYRRIS